MGLDLEAIHRFLRSILHTLTSIRHFLYPIHHILISIRHFLCSLHHFFYFYPSLRLPPHTFLYNFYPPHTHSYPSHHSLSPASQLPQPKQKAHQQLGELSDNLLILVIGFEGAFHFAFGFFFAHVVTFIVVFFPFADTD